jgi:hypothetical protein
MTSSISSSKISKVVSDDQRRRARRFCIYFLVSVVCLLAIALGGLAFLDPFDTGRLTLLDQPGALGQSAHTANASIARDQNYDSAIFGNSHIELLDWRALSEAAGLKFAMLAARATAAKQQFAFMDYFTRRHSVPRAIVIGLDVTWCFESMIEVRAFPYWLYDPSSLVYLRGLFRYASLERLPGRIGRLVGWIEPVPLKAVDESEYLTGPLGKPEQHVRMAATSRYSVPYNKTGVFAPVTPLKEFLARLPAETVVILVWTPVFINNQPQAGSPAAAMVEACHRSYVALAAARPRTAVIDWETDRPENREIANFWDPTHYRASLARSVERDIAVSLKAIIAGK